MNIDILTENFETRLLAQEMVIDELGTDFNSDDLRNSDIYKTKLFLRLSELPGFRKDDGSLLDVYHPATRFMSDSSDVERMVRLLRWIATGREVEFIEYNIFYRWTTTLGEVLQSIDEKNNNARQLYQKLLDDDLIYCKTVGTLFLAIAK